ncbi:helix-turn-helix domain-containing protein [Nocardia shimofusensis]|uniref:helix-turn-helix domain-containing protein n=1 Tax=Nocardia shimofusensis TaxID=228596 RepID=UPI001471904A
MSQAQRRELVRSAWVATSTHAYALRCRIVLACAEPGAANAHVAAAVGVTAMTVAKWRHRFIATPDLPPWATAPWPDTLQPAHTPMNDSRSPWTGRRSPSLPLRPDKQLAPSQRCEVRAPG